MKLASVLAISVLVLGVSTAPVLAQSDNTTTILQGLQSLHSGAAGQGGGMNFDQAKAAAIAKASMTAIDTDKNGSVNRTELASLTNKFFDVADGNGDGQLSEDELSTFAANMNTVLTFLR